MPDQTPLKRHESLIPFSRDHYVGLVQSQHLLKAAKEDDTSRRKAVADFIDVWAIEVEPHFSDEERLLPRFMCESDAVRFEADHARIRSLAKQAADQRRQIAPDAEWMRELGQTLHDHIRWEERQLFPTIEQNTAPQQLEVLRQQTSKVEASRPRARRANESSV